ncbi:ABC transporter permease, partial [Leptospira santarosai]|nr:ABC transporter permease [Leptospira santarosai]
QNLDKLPADSFKRITIDSSAAERISKPSLSFWQDAWLRIRKNKAAIVSIVILILIILMSFIGPMLSPHDAETQTLTHANLPPKVQGFENLGFWDGVGNMAGTDVDLYELKKVDTYYWFGTDGLGRDMFSRVW